MLKRQENNVDLMRFPVITFLILVASIRSQATNKIPRVSVQTYYQGTVMKIFLSPGSSGIIDFPCQVTKASGGTGGDLHVTLATSIGNEVDLALDSSVAHSTSLIVRCKENVFVFDVIPSKVNHQNYIKIKQSRGAIKYYSEPDEYSLKMSGEIIGTKGLRARTQNQYDLSKLQKIDSGIILKSRESSEQRAVN